jgi:ribulose-phosphate 3-epimerase
MNVEIIPAILVNTFDELQEKVDLVKLGTDRIQVDICDGQFTPSATWPYRKTDNNFEMIVREDQAMPSWETLDYEFDLMVNNPEEVVDDWVSAGATRIVLHLESKGDVREAIRKLIGRVEIGIALNIDTPVEEIRNLRLELGDDAIQFVQLMGIDHIGFQGQQFDVQIIDKIHDIKEMYPDMLISIDGGVSLETAPSLIDAGADRLIVGSAIINSENPLGALEEFQNMI